MTFRQRLTRIFDKWMPDFLGIGAARAGTTWVWHVLRQHPDIWTPRSKELHFFDRRLSHLPRDFPNVLRARFQYGLYFIPGRLQGKVTGEFTPAYGVLSEERIELVRDWMPYVKLIFIMRDPVLRAWSHAKKDFQRKMGKRLAEASPDDLVAFFDLPGVAERGDYVSCLRRWMNYFPKEQFFTLFLEEVQEHPGAVVKDLFQFLGVEAIDLDEMLLRRPIHQSQQRVEIPEWLAQYLRERLYSQNDEIKALIGRELPWK